MQDGLVGNKSLQIIDYINEKYGDIQDNLERVVSLKAFSVSIKNYPKLTRGKGKTNHQ